MTAQRTSVLPAERSNISSGFNDQFAGERARGGLFTVDVLSNLSFGSFCVGPGGGSVHVNANGGRTAEGDVILLYTGQPPTPVRLEVRCVPFTMLHLQVIPQFTLSGQGSQQINAALADTHPEMPLVTPPGSARGFTITAGGNLELPPSLNHGEYQSSFSVMLIRE
jgi:hypothetical protein